MPGRLPTFRKGLTTFSGKMQKPAASDDRVCSFVQSDPGSQCTYPHTIVLLCSQLQGFARGSPKVPETVPPRRKRQPAYSARPPACLPQMVRPLGMLDGGPRRYAASSRAIAHSQARFDLYIHVVGRQFHGLLELGHGLAEPARPAKASASL